MPGRSPPPGCIQAPPRTVRRDCQARSPGPGGAGLGQPGARPACRDKTPSQPALEQSAHSPAVLSLPGQSPCGRLRRPGGASPASSTRRRPDSPRTHSFVRRASLPLRKCGQNRQICAGKSRPSPGWSKHCRMAGWRLSAPASRSPSDSGPTAHRLRPSCSIRGNCQAPAPRPVQTSAQPPGSAPGGSKTCPASCSWPSSGAAVQ